MKKQNVIVFFTDQQRFGTLGLYGNPDSLTPHIDRLGREGVVFENTYTPNPICTPARACLQTGQYCHTHGVYRNGVAIPANYPTTIAGSFRAAGYETGYIGKWHLGSAGAGPVPPEERAGYDYWLAANCLEVTSEPYKTIVYDNDGNEVFLPGYRPDALTDAAIRYVTEKRDEPFFLTLSLLEPHEQNTLWSFLGPDRVERSIEKSWVPPDLASIVSDSPRAFGLTGGLYRGAMSAYLGMIHRIDQNVGRLQDALKSLGIDNDTLVLFTADHGDNFHTRCAHDKCSCHDSSARVPCVAWGGSVPRGRRVPTLFNLVDIAPTLLDACGIDVPAAMQGRSFFGHIHGEPAPYDDEMSLIQVAEMECGRAIRTRRWKYGVRGTSADPVADSHDREYQEMFLYDLESDPYELYNLVHSPTHGVVKTGLQKRLCAKLEEIGEPQPVIVSAEEDSTILGYQVSREDGLA